MKHRVFEDEYQHFDEPVVPGSEKSLRFVIEGTKWDDGRFDMCLTDGFGEKQTVVYRNGGSIKSVYYNMAKYRKRDGSVFIRVRNWRNEWIDFGNHTVVDVKVGTVGLSSAPTLVDKNGLINSLKGEATLIDENGLINFLNGEGGLTFDNDHWLKFSKDSTFNSVGGDIVKVQCGDEYNLLNTLDFTLVFPEWSRKMVLYSVISLYNPTYPKMINNELFTPSEGCAFMRRSDGKVDMLSINRGSPFILTEGLDDVFVSAASYVYALSKGKLFVVGCRGNSIECEGIMETKVPGKLAMKSHGMWRIVISNLKRVYVGSVSTTCMLMRDSSEPFDGIYEKNTYFPVVMRDGKYNYLDLYDKIDMTDYDADYDGSSPSPALRTALLSDATGTGWFDYAEPVEDDSGEYVFRVELDGERKVYALDGNYQLKERDPED